MPSLMDVAARVCQTFEVAELIIHHFSPGPVNMKVVNVLQSPRHHKVWNDFKLPVENIVFSSAVRYKQGRLG